MAENFPTLMLDQKTQRISKQDKYIITITKNLYMHIQITEIQRENLERNQTERKPYLQPENVEFSKIMFNLLEMKYRKLSL